jgi:glucosyl-3-phosphoglycerate synthase
MSDFCQTGLVATFHRLGRPKLERLEDELRGFARQRPIALVLPALYSEVEGPALPGIIEELKKVKYLEQTVVTMGGANTHEFKRAKEFFATLSQRPMIVWNTGPRISALYDKLENAGMRVGGDGKGRSCWMAYGYILACQRSQVIALHDCDIVNYSRELLARLIYPVTNPNTDYEFSKGFYARVTDRMYGRATRLLIAPLIRSMLDARRDRASSASHRSEGSIHRRERRSNLCACWIFSFRHRRQLFARRLRSDRDGRAILEACRSFPDVSR